MSRIHSPTYREKRKKRRIRWSIISVVIVIIVIGGSIYAARDTRFVIANVVVSGASFSDPQQIQAEAQKEISGDYLFVYPKANELFYPKKRIEADILRDFPAVQSVSVSVSKGLPPSGPNLDVQVKERQPFTLWCGDAMEMPATASSSESDASLSQCYFADENGYIFSEAPHFSGDLYPVFYGGLGEATGTVPMASTSESDPTNVIRNSILTPSRLAQVMAFAKNVGLIGFNLNTYQITEDPSGDICDLYYGTTTASYLRVDCDDNFSNDSANLASFIADPHFATSTLSGYQYIDLRFGDKIVYKEK